MLRKPWWVFAIFLLSCSQIQFKRELVSLDSYPRGAKVFKKKEEGKLKPLGTSPLFIKEPKNDFNPFVFQFFDGDQLVKSQEVIKENKCSMVWTEPLIDKIPILKKLIPDFVKNFGEEYNPINQLGKVRGGTLECFSYARSIAVNLDVESNDCKKLVVIPPPHSSKKVTEHIQDQWKEKVFNKNKNSCDELLSSEVAAAYLDFLGLDHMNRRYGKKYLGQAMGAKIGKRFGVTHVVFLAFQQSDFSFEVRPEVYDLHLNLKNAKNFEESFTTTYNYKKRNLFVDKIGEAFQLIPNTISLKTKIQQNIGLKNKSAEANYGNEISTLSFPPSIRLSYIEYPHQDWVVNFRFGPSFGYRRFKTDFNIKFIDTVMAMKLFFTTPIATLLARVGYGGSYINVNGVQNEFSTDRYVSMGQYGFEAYHFVTERIFFNLGFRKNVFNEDKIVFGDFNLKSYSQFFFNIGYYTPEFKINFRKLFYP